ncbi:hypothetical protein ABIB62_001562 [Mucilaginibacter sp. UYP25]|uniref:hypothetical protein n=1 Tax=unclassified Mucilaginibacter TaxID=2617802 RepID=UPI003393E46D
MNTTETLTNAQLFLTTKATTRLSNLSDSDVTDITLRSFIYNILAPFEALAMSRVQPENEDFRNLIEINNVIFEDGKCSIKQVASLVNCFVMLLMLGQRPENINLTHEIAGQVTQNILDHLSI